VWGTPIEIRFNSTKVDCRDNQLEKLPSLFKDCFTGEWITTEHQAEKSGILVSWKQSGKEIGAAGTTTSTNNFFCEVAIY